MNSIDTTREEITSNQVSSTDTVNADLLEALKGMVMFPLGQFQLESALRAIKNAEGE